MTDIESIAGVLVWTSSDCFEEMAEFYVGVLGLRPRSRRPGFVNFEWGTQRLTVAVHSEVTGMSADPNRIMINLTVSDIHATWRRLKGLHVTFSRPPEQESWGGWIATFADPDGNALQLLQQR